jgi:hypothetical protein
MPESNVFDIAGLILKSIREEANGEELGQLEQWLEEEPDNRLFYDALNDADSLALEYREYKSVDMDATWQKLLGRIEVPESAPEQVPTQTPVIAIEEIKSTNSNKNVYWLSAAIAVMVIIIAGIYVYKQQPVPVKVVKVNNAGAPEPGSNKAILVRADGSKYELQDLPNGELPVTGGGIKYQKQDGKIVCSLNGMQVQTGAFDSLIVPPGGRFTLVLPDGTEVWLNSASSIRYPAGLTATERKVTMTGEAYFEIAHDKAKPFIVSVRGNSLQALGTKFNVNAYEPDASVRTSLLDGKLLITSKKDKKVLEPNNTALISPTTEIKILPEDNISKVIAWKNGEFEFDNEPIVSVARQIGRWYNMRVFIEGTPNTRVTYSDSMNKKIDITLEGIRTGNNKIHISRTDSTIIVKP